MQPPSLSSRRVAAGAVGAGAIAALGAQWTQAMVMSVAVGGPGGPPPSQRYLRSGIYNSGPISHTQGGVTFYTWQWGIQLFETSPGNWLAYPFGIASWTGTNPPFDGVAVQIQTSAVPNASIVIRFDNTLTVQDQPSNFGNTFGQNPAKRSGIEAWADATVFTTYLIEFHPADTFIDVDTVALTSFVS